MSATYKRKTKDEWTIEGSYGYGDGWEDLSAYETLSEARADLHAYRENEPTYPYRLIKRRVPVETAADLAS